MASKAPKAVLQGGPEGITERIVEVTPDGGDLKIPFRGGYEHFRPTAREWDTADGRLPVYEWWERTELPG
ncbi:hypothetical protein ADL22_24000 [Streptomyces sp. NRRL F-4489]|uniref:DUF5988 family protein n=1 Tax=Streptomyces sp. NRRL F-4489 TaxID=1609095 RepID=UPI00074A52E7|nr:DUF5988 family protein [Streptomyces sp. NRRL F-4489]KUL36520.1 hypothetical protein ADL22_24000 [Streptomyces sp. NRRL F-4489]